ncbi:MAG: DUF4091 domain-containing protein [Deltaproteobacteria bacterium]|nr:DUF4091 domain-containing protein [Deltaproteobacteria bacterium]
MSPFKSAFLLLLELLVAAPAPAAQLEIYPNGEKPIVARPSRSDAPVRLDLARDGNATISVRLPQAAGGAGKLVLLDTASLKLKDAPAGAATVRAYVAGVHVLAKSSYKYGAAGEVPDILVPAELARGRGFKLPRANVPSRPIYIFDVHADEKARPGTYDGELAFEARGESFSVPLKVRIYSTLLPKKFQLRTSFGFAPWSALKKHYGAWNAAELDLYAKYHALATEHRIDLHKIYLSLPTRAEGGDLLATGAAGQRFVDLWKRVEPSWSTTDLPVAETMKYPATKSAAEQAEIRKFWQDLELSVERHDLKNSTFVYFVDEPKPETFSKLAASLKLIRQWAPGLTYLGTTAFDRRLEGAFNAWCVNLVQWDVPGFARPDVYERRRQEKGEKLWLYTSCNSHGCSGPQDFHLPDLMIDRPSAFQRSFAWMGLRYHADGILYYDTVNGYREKSDSPFQDTFEFTGYGEGNLFYPCTPAFCGTEGQEALASFRLKALRDGLEDVQLLSMARAKGAPVDDWVKELIPGARRFPSDTEPYEKLKARALESLEPR